MTIPSINDKLSQELAEANSPPLNQEVNMTLRDTIEGQEYIIRDINTNDEELNAFLFTLGCYSGEPITVISRRRSGCTVSIKDSRYHMDNHLAGAITVW